MSKSFSSLLQVLLLTIIVIFIYQDGYLDYARRDHILYMKERAYLPNDSAWFAHSFNLNRTRVTYSGDYLLFRPGLLFVLTIEDIYLRQHQLFTGLLSIAWHLMVVILFYLILKRYFKGTGAFLWAALFASQYLGIEMILWRHISPYMLSMFFMLMGFWVFFRTKHTIATVCFLSAMVFHEVAPVACMLFLVLIFLAKDRREKVSVGALETAKLIRALGLAIITFFVFDMISWVMTKPSEVLTSSEHISWNLGFMGSALQNFLLYLGAGLRSVFDFFSMPLIWNKSAGWIFEFDIFKDHVSIYYIWAAIAGAMILTSMIISLRRVRVNQATPADFISLWVCCALIALTGIFSFFRMTLRGPGYANSATYYYWFFSLFFITLLKYLIDQLLNKVSVLEKKTISRGIYVLLMATILGQMWMGRNSIKENYHLAEAKKLSQAIHAGMDYFTRNPHACLDKDGETIHSSILKLGTLPLYLRKYNCSPDSALTMMHIVRDTNGAIHFEPGPY